MALTDKQLRRRSALVIAILFAASLCLPAVKESVGGDGTPRWEFGAAMALVGLLGPFELQFGGLANIIILASTIQLASGARPYRVASIIAAGLTIYTLFLFKSYNLDITIVVLGFGPGMALWIVCACVNAAFAEWDARSIQEI